MRSAIVYGVMIGLALVAFLLAHKAEEAFGGRPGQRFSLLFWAFFLAMLFLLQWLSWALQWLSWAFHGG